MDVRNIRIPRAEWKNCLTGALELACFLEQGIARFSNTVEETLRSYWIVLLGFSLNCSAIMIIHQEHEHLSETPIALLLYYSLIRVAFFNLCQAAGLYFLCKWSRRLETFPRLLTAANWLQMIPLIAMIPLHAMVWADMHNVEEAAMLETLFVIYFLCVQAFCIARTTRLPLVIGGYVMVMLFMVDRITLSMMLI